MCELVGESTLSIYKIDVAPLNYMIYAICYMLYLDHSLGLLASQKVANYP